MDRPTLGGHQSQRIYQETATCASPPQPAESVLLQWAEYARQASGAIADECARLTCLADRLGIPQCPECVQDRAAPATNFEGVLGELCEALEGLSPRLEWLQSAVNRLIEARLA